MALELMGLKETADLLGVSKQAAANYYLRHADFPQPVAELACGKIWLKQDIVAWKQRRGK